MRPHGGTVELPRVRGQLHEKLTLLIRCFLKGKLPQARIGLHAVIAESRIYLPRLRIGIDPPHLAEVVLCHLQGRFLIQFRGSGYLIHPYVENAACFLQPAIFLPLLQGPFPVVRAKAYLRLLGVGYHGLPVCLILLYLSQIIGIQAATAAAWAGSALSKGIVPICSSARTIQYMSVCPISSTSVPASSMARVIC